MTERVLGLGGIFLKARDPAALADWYRTALGLDVQDWGGFFGTTFAGTTEPGAATWTVFPADADYFPGAAMVNFRVADLAAMLAQVSALGAVVEDGGEATPLGRFGWVIDPEGNRVELWEPPAA